MSERSFIANERTSLARRRAAINNVRWRIRMAVKIAIAASHGRKYRPQFDGLGFPVN
jgi:hypothetical protein